MTLLYKNEHISCTNYAEEFNKPKIRNYHPIHD